MQDERHYNINFLNKLFAIAAFVLLSALGLVFLKDYARPWKKYQVNFRDMEVEKTRVKHDLASGDLAQNSEYQDLKMKEKESSLAVEAKSTEIKDLQSELKKIKAENDLIKQNSRFAKAELDAAKYAYEHTLEKNSGHPFDRSALDKLQSRVDRLRLEEERSDDALESIEVKIRNHTEALRDYEKQSRSLARKVDLLERKLQKIDPQEMSFVNQIANVVRDLPVLELANPNFRVEQIVLKDITDDVNFMRVPKVERCTTCHLGIANPEYINAPQPLTTHPNLDLFLSSDSAHPMEEFGCTVCHEGRGRGTDFTSAAHTPADDQQQKLWEQKYNWHTIHHWEHPMYGAPYVEAGCLKCHSGQETIKGAEKLNLGIQLVEKAGCYGCHNIDKFKGWPKPGPDLSRLASKTNKKWAYLWIKDPHGFRDNTWMPGFFNQSNNADPESTLRSEQEIHAIVHYLFARSQEYKHDEIPFPGDPQKGEELVKSLGCLGCHDLNANPQKDTIKRAALMREFGPNLIGMGAKTTKSWLYNWLKNPGGFSHTTRMPDMRLSDREAADIASYLVANKDAALINRDVPPLDAAVLDEIVKSFLAKMYNTSQRDKKLGEMKLEDKLEFAGQKLIRHYGCFGCHEIPGFKDEKPIGTDLTEWGSKSADKLDFGFADVPHTTAAFATMKLKDPRAFDKDKLRDPGDKLRMPNFYFTEDEIEAVTTVLLGLVKEKPSPSKMVPRTPKNLFIEEGQKIVRQFNCQGCHIIESEGGAIAPSVTQWLVAYQEKAPSEAEAMTVSFSPPNLINQGKKVQPDWLFEFLHDPTVIRPWLKVRMPTFTLSEDERNGLIRYFNYLDDEPFPFPGTSKIHMTVEELQAARKLFSKEYFSCAQCHIVGDKFPEGTPDRWAPDFNLARKRLKSKWLYDWIKNPAPLMPGTKMPTFYDPSTFDHSGPDDIFNGDENEQIRVLRDYILTIEDHPPVSTQPQ